MRSFRDLLFSLVMGSLLAFSAVASPLPEPTVDYAADIVLTVSQDQGQAPMTIPGRLFYSAGNERRESAMMGRKSISIRHGKEDRFYVLMPERRMYLESSGSGTKKQKDPSAAMLDGDVNLEKVGSEMVNGIPADKYQFNSLDQKNNQTTGYLWFSEDWIPLKMEGTTRQQGRTSRFASELSNLEIAQQPASLFSIPPGYTKLQTPSMIGGMGNLQGDNTMLPDGPAGNAGAGMGMSPEDLQKLQQQLEQFKKQMQQQ